MCWEIYCIHSNTPKALKPCKSPRHLDTKYVVLGLFILDYWWDLRTSKCFTTGAAVSVPCHAVSYKWWESFPEKRFFFLWRGKCCVLLFILRTHTHTHTHTHTRTHAPNSGHPCSLSAHSKRLNSLISIRSQLRQQKAAWLRDAARKRNKTASSSNTSNEM